MAKKKKREQQQKIAEEVTAQKERRELKRQIALLKRLPKDFRDLDPGSPDWEAFAEITARRKEMEAWAAGPMYVFRPFNSHEAMVFKNEVIQSVLLWPLEGFKVLQAMSFCKASWLYLPDEELKVIIALNLVLSRCGVNFRARGQLLSERSGKPIGIVH